MTSQDNRVKVAMETPRDQKYYRMENKKTKINDMETIFFWPTWEIVSQESFMKEMVF